MPSVWLEVETDFGAQRSRGHIVRPAERRKEVVNRFLVGHVDGLQAQAPFVTVAAKQIVVADRQIEQAATGHPRRIVVVVLGTGLGNLQEYRTVLR